MGRKDRVDSGRAVLQGRRSCRAKAGHSGHLIRCIESGLRAAARPRQMRDAPLVRPASTIQNRHRNDPPLRGLKMQMPASTKRHDVFRRTDVESPLSPSRRVVSQALPYKRFLVLHRLSLVRRGAASYRHMTGAAVARRHQEYSQSAVLYILGARIPFLLAFLLTALRWPSPLHRQPQSPPFKQL